MKEIIYKKYQYEEIGSISQIKIASIEWDSGRSKEKEDTPYKVLLYIPGFKINTHFSTPLEAKKVIEKVLITFIEKITGQKQE
jgi:hypothetical protein